MSRRTLGRGDVQDHPAERAVIGDVIIIEDDRNVADSLSALCAAAGYRVAVFYDGCSALGALQPAMTGCVLLDLHLPDSDGIEILTRIAEIATGLRVVMLTGRADVALAVSAMKAGAVDFLEKPARPEAVLTAIGAVLESVRQADPDLRARYATLTPRECEVMERIVSGRSNKEVARDLNISDRTAEVHRRNLMRKMEASGLPDLVRMSLSLGVGAETV